MSTIVRNVQLGSPAALPQRTKLSLAEGISFNEWREIGEELIAASNASLWWIADWAAYGDRRFRKNYWPALQEMRPGGYAWQTLHNVGSVARKVDPSRRREGLSFSHHAEIAALEPELQDVWLDDAEDHRWSVMQLREELARHRRGDREPRMAFSMRAVGELYEIVTKGASASGVDPKQWLEEAAREKYARQFGFAARDNVGIVVRQAEDQEDDR